MPDLAHEIAEAVADGPIHPDLVERIQRVIDGRAAVLWMVAGVGLREVLKAGTTEETARKVAATMECTLFKLISTEAR